MKTTTGEPFELLTTPVPAAGGSTTAGARLGSVESVDSVEPDVLGLGAPAALAFIWSRRVAQDAAAAEELRGLCHWADPHRVTPGRELDEGAIDPVLLAQPPAEHEAQVAAAKARILGQPVPDWATERLTSTPGELGAEGQLRLDGQGCFMVHEFAITHLATELGLTEAAARAQVGQSVELRDRLPRLYRQVMAGVLPAWKGRKIAQHTLPLSDEAAAYVDAHLAPFAHMLSVWRILKAVDTAITRHDPDRATALAEAAAEERGVWVDHGPHGPADLPVADSTSRIEATVDTPDALAFEDTIAAVAAVLADLGHQGSLDARRAKAVGVLADPQHALELTGAAAENAAMGEPAEQMRPKVRQRKRLGGTTLHLHLHTAALGQLSPVARIDGLGPRPAAAVRQWLAGLAPGAQVTVTPVVDLAERISVDAHEAPPILRAQIDHLDTGCVFPWCGRQGRYDLDHITEYADPADGGPPGQTNSQNLAKLCRYHHRVKTHTAWAYLQEPDPVNHLDLTPGQALHHRPHRHPTHPRPALTRASPRRRPARLARRAPTRAEPRTADGQCGPPACHEPG
ncbi:HNH endonuclease signature motif containing protein [Nocardioides caldifontis]|uniref:HNH endonuclease signature motif containing protein n=1 Tax=Nocardioides caldifontis TaxID=2588938 RepID=UPI0011E00EB1|nr:HNH endonuclease signature motif containing protein [Nocardioides caldifontis]